MHKKYVKRLDFQHDNDTKYSSKLIKSLLDTNKIKIPK